MDWKLFTSTFGVIFLALATLAMAAGGSSRCTVRWERHAENFLGFVQLGCICILLRHF